MKVKDAFPWIWWHINTLFYLVLICSVWAPLFDSYFRFCYQLEDIGAHNLLLSMEKLHQHWVKIHYCNIWEWSSYCNSQKPRVQTFVSSLLSLTSGSYCDMDLRHYFQKSWICFLRSILGSKFRFCGFY